MSHKSICLVLGETFLPSILQPFVVLASQYKVTVFTQHQARDFESFAPYFRIESFGRVEDLPGYLRGFEKKVEGFDLFIVFECTSVSSFQGLMAAKKDGRPLVVSSSEWQPGLYEGFVNILAMQREIMAYASHFVAPVPRAKAYLEAFDVSSQRISVLPSAVDSRVFYRDEEKRKRFRQYLHLSPTSFVLLVHAPLVTEEHPEYFLKALRLFLEQKTLESMDVRLLFAGKGELAQELKYKAYDWGIGNHVFFLHQDTSPFLIDLYCACDGAVFYPLEPLDSVAASDMKKARKPLPYKVIEATACGLLPCVGEGSIEEELVGSGRKICFDGKNPESFAKALSELFDRDETLSQSAEVMNSAQSESWLGIAADALRSADALPPSPDFEVFLSSLKDMHHRDAAAAVLHFLETSHSLSPENKSKVLTIRGDSLRYLGDLEASIKAFEDALTYDENNFKAYLGLGYVSLSSHSYEEAVAFFKKALLYVSDARISMGLGLSYRGLSLLPLAIFWFEKAVLEEDGVGASLNSLVAACKECPNLIYAITCLERVRKQVGDLMPLSQCLDSLYLKEGKVSRQSS